MLACLEVRDFAYIAHARLELPQAGFCVLTGETGVGKSLLVDALALGLGGRLAHDVVRKGAKAAEISLLLELPESHPVHEWLEEQGLGSASEGLVIRRTINDNRRSRANINGRIAAVGQLSALGDSLLGICGQHEHLQLLDGTRRRELLDGAAGSSDDLVATAQAYEKWDAAKTELESANAMATQAVQRLADLDASLDELHGLGVSTERLEEQNRILTLQGNAAELSDLHESLRSNLQQAAQALAGCRDAAVRLAELDERCAGLAEQLVAMVELGNDASREQEKLGGDGEQLDAAALAEAEAFVAEAHRLARKYQLPSTASLPNYMADMEKERASLVAVNCEKLQQQVDAALKNWRECAARLSAKRAKAAKELGAKVQATLRQLGMPDARFAVRLEPLKQPSPQGAETIAFTFAARKSGSLEDIAEVASGGELSRMSLALFSHATGNGGRDLVFDEVDTGIGGKAAAHVGSLLARLGQDRLVLCVTHLPQVAATASCHWQVTATEDGAAFSLVEGDAREEEIARMLAGRKVTKASRANAKDILAAASG